MKSLQRIQKIMKVLKILSLIAFIGSIIGVISCFISFIVLAALSTDSELIQQLIEQYSKVGLIPEGYNLEEGFTILKYIVLIGAVQCAISAVIYFFAKKLYSYELEIGTPFDKDFVKQVRKVAIIRIVTPLVGSIIVSIIGSILLTSSIDANTSYSASISMGIVYLIVSCFFDYGADINHLPSENNNSFESKENNENQLPEL